MDKIKNYEEIKRDVLNKIDSISTIEGSFADITVGPVSMELEKVYTELNNIQSKQDIENLEGEDVDRLDLCQYFGQKFRFFCESPPPLTIRTEMLAGYHPKAKNSKQAIHIAFVRLNCSISLSNNQGQAPLGRLASP